MLTVLLLRTALAAPPVWNAVPFGVGVYLHHRPLRGVVYSVTQAAGIATLVASSVEANRASVIGDEDGVARMQPFVIAGGTTAAVSYIVSLVDASRLHDIETRDATSWLRAWDAARQEHVVAAEPFAQLRPPPVHPGEQP